MDIDTLIGLAAAPFIIPALVGATKPLVRLVFPKVCNDDVENSPWQFLSAVYGALWMVGLVHSGHAPEEIDSFWTAILVGIALGLGSGVVRTVTKAGVERVAPEKAAEMEGRPPSSNHTDVNVPVWVLGGEPTVPPYEPPRRSS